MASGVGDDGLQPVTVDFRNGNRGTVVFAAPRRSVETLLAALGLTESRPVLLVIGGADSLDPTIAADLEKLFERGAVRAAADAGATIIDGATASGVIAILGRASAASDATVELVGVAPAGKVTYEGDDRGLAGATTSLDPNHTHFVLANSAEWGGETSLLFDVLGALSADRPSAAILAGGGPVALDEVRMASQLGIPIIVITGTGGLADDLAAQSRVARGGRAADRFADVLAATDLIFLPVAADPADLEAVVTRRLEVDETLAEAWRQQELLSAAATRQRRGFQIGQAALLSLGLLLTLLVVIKAVLEREGIIATNPSLGTALYYVILALPIIIGILAAAASRMRPGGRWILLRGTSESLKREIFRYRARAGRYSHEQTRRTSREIKLAETIGSALGALMRTDVNMLALEATRDPLSDGGRDGRGPAGRMTTLTPAGYVKQRIDPQIHWYRRAAARSERSARWLRWLALAFGGIGTLLAAIGFDIWVAVTTALVGVFTTFLEAWQLETSVSLYNQAATDLTAIRTWWFALPPSEQDRQRAIDRLVDRAERIIRAENAGWVQEMQDAMTQLRLEQADDEASDGAGRDVTRRREPDDAEANDPRGSA